MKLQNMFKKTSRKNYIALKERPEVPEGLLRKCNKCGAAIIAEDVKQGYYICPKCGGYFRVCFGGGALWSAVDGYYLRTYAVLLVLLTVGSANTVKAVWERLPERAREALAPVLMLAGLVLCTAYLVDGSYNPFLYFRF